MSASGKLAREDANQSRTNVRFAMSARRSAVEGLQ